MGRRFIIGALAAAAALVMGSNIARATTPPYDHSAGEVTCLGIPTCVGTHTEDPTAGTVQLDLTVAAAATDTAGNGSSYLVRTLDGWDAVTATASVQVTHAEQTGRGTMELVLAEAVYDPATDRYEVAPGPRGHVLVSGVGAHTWQLTLPARSAQEGRTRAIVVGVVGSAVAGPESTTALPVRTPGIPIPPEEGCGSGEGRPGCLIYIAPQDHVSTPGLYHSSISVAVEVNDITVTTQ